MKIERTSAREVNREAGDHAVSSEPFERRAAEEAVRRSWREFPYYAKRYGERGWKFSLSDTGWIETLCEHDLGSATEQVRWLSRLLAARGMPSYMLERHLCFLGEELVAARPERKLRYDLLRRCEGMMRGVRRAQLADEKFFELAAACDARTDDVLRNVGVLAASAVLDDHAGHGAALSSFRAWTCDVDRFAASFIDAVEETIAEASAALRS